jgi:phosphoglycolate phosphatase
MPPCTVVFDLDGTLVDSAPDLVAALNVVLVGASLQPVAYEAGRTMVGGGARVMVERGLKANGRELPPAAIDRMVRDFITYYADHIAVHSQPFDGVETVLDKLAESGCRLAVCTNKLEWLSVRLLDALKLTRRFHAICGPDTFGVSKPDPKILHGTIERAGGNPARAIMIGDSMTDIATARAAGVPIIAVDFGYTDIPIETLKPDRVVSAFAELPQAISQTLSTGQIGVV